MCRKGTLSWLCVALAVSAWGVTFASTRFLLGDFSPLEILVLRFSIAFAALWLVGRFTGGTDCCGWRNEWIFAAMGLSGIVVYQFLENCAICSMNASSVAIVVSFGPIVTAILAEPPSLLAWPRRRLELKASARFRLVRGGGLLEFAAA